MYDAKEITKRDKVIKQMQSIMMAIKSTPACWASWSFVDEALAAAEALNTPTKVFVRGDSITAEVDPNTPTKDQD